MFCRNNGKLYLEYEAYGRTVQKSTRLPDTPLNRSMIQKEVIPALQAKILRGDFSVDVPKKFSHYSEIFLRSKIHNKTYKRITMHVEQINVYFGDIRIDKIKRSDIKNWVQDMLETRSPKTVRNYMASLVGVIDVAIDHEVIHNNVARNIKLPEHDVEEIEPFTDDEVRRILDAADGFLKLYLAIGFFTGMRMGEILGLMWSDIDLDKKVIRVRRSVVDGNVTTPKTKKSIREVPILDDLLPYLEFTGKSLWLFVKADGFRVNRFGENHYREWRVLLATLGIKYRKPYATRHTFIVSMLKHSDMSIMQIAQLVGHSTTQMIIRNYGKFIKGEHLKVDRKLKLFTDKSADSSA
ncbi:tyrosine-type recombinase/integrase [Sulfurovum lithotrophicum]